MTLRTAARSSRERAGVMMASWSISPRMTARAMRNASMARLSSRSTSSRSSLFCRAMRMNWRTISSRLSLSNLWPRTAVTWRFFSRVSSIRVGLTCVAGI